MRRAVFVCPLIPLTPVLWALTAPQPAAAAVTLAESGFTLDTYATGIPRPDHMAFGPDGGLFVGDTVSHKVWRVDPDRSVSAWVGAGLVSPGGIVVDPLGTVFIADADSEGISGTGTVFISEGADDLDVFSNGAPLVDPLGMVFAPEGFGAVGGHILIADWNALSGPGGIFVLPEGGGAATLFASSANFLTPTDVDFTPDGRLYAVDESRGFFRVGPYGGVTWELNSQLTAIAIHPGTGEIFATGANGIEKVFRIRPAEGETAATITEFATGFANISDYSGGITFTPDCTALLVGDQGAQAILAIHGFEACALYDDLDGDGYAELAGAHPGGDCDDTDAALHPGAEEIPYDGIDQDCDGGDLVDVDGDGYAAAQAGGGDCEDEDPAVHPGATDECDGADNDCDGRVDQAYDLDGDGHPSAQTCPSIGDDCYDTRDDIHPGAVERCDEADNDCDGATDEGAQLTLYADADGDAYGDPQAPVLACGATAGAVFNDRDCDDGDGGISPAGEEVAYDGIDQDCDGGDLVDVDDDGYASTQVGGEDCDDQDPSIRPGSADKPYDGIDQDCDGGDLTDVDGDGVDATQAGGEDCDDRDVRTFPGAPEYGDGDDNDCDGRIDEGLDSTDDDGDGYSEDQGDCDDADATTSPGAEEVEDGGDDDCDGRVDEGTSAFDDDGDGYAEVDGDCDDANPALNPGATDLCGDGIDQDCQGGDCAPPTPTPTEAPTPSLAPTEAPTDPPTAEPTVFTATDAPTAAPTAEPTAEPTDAPTAEPTDAPTAEPTDAPTAEPTAEPTVAPTAPVDLGTSTPVVATPTDPASGGEGCDCDSSHRSGGGLWVALALLGLVWRRRR